ncbi:MAG: helix-turn-helix domain-containing protein [Planctomycetota bacterium]|jgi:excisionase family DNA binding protein|nr:helix-turn-helix domain-containing protein [Planctomycetota bacterium]MDP6837381.1 helix-turn-helix domain-containing protein [Planctomycetota bacterium]MDP6955506.1 helix-turn-helix domain-containing protein [Planctomycetota bacterium]
MTINTDKAILNIDEAAALLGVSVKTFNKVLHAGEMPARKIGREWKFSRQALIDWVGSGRSREFYAESRPRAEKEKPVAPRSSSTRGRPRRTDGWKIDLT